MDVSRIVGQLTEIVGDAHVAVDMETLLASGFGSDMHPAVLTHPGSPDEVRRIVDFANSSRIPLIPMGGGTHIGQVLTPFENGIGISLKRLNRILELETDNLSVTVEAGVLNETLQSELKPWHLFLPVFSDFPESTIGGQAAADFSSRKRYRYGSISDYVLGVEFVSPQGQIIRTGGKTVKNASGYDFTKMLAGSWGTMGVITSVIFKLKPLPEKEVLIHARFASAAEAIEAGNRVLAAKPTLSAINLLPGIKSPENPDNPPEVSMVFALEGSREAVADHLKKISAHLGNSFGIMIDAALIESFWQDYHRIRREIKSGTAGMAIFDKRLTREMIPFLSLLHELDLAYDFDLAAGVMEFSLPQGERFLEEFQGRWDELAQGMKRGLGWSFQVPTGQPLLERLIQKIDPLGLMFPANGLLRGVNRG